MLCDSCCEHVLREMAFAAGYSGNAFLYGCAYPEICERQRFLDTLKKFSGNKRIDNVLKEIREVINGRGNQKVIQEDQEGRD